MRSRWRTTEFWGTVILFGLMASFVKKDPTAVCLSIFLVSSSYSIARSLTKRNIGTTKTSIMTSEFYIEIISMGIFFLSMWKYGLPVRIGIVLIGLTQAIYSIGRGISKTPIQRVPIGLR